MTFPERVALLIEGLSPAAHPAEIAALRACRALPDLERLAAAGWLTAEGARKRVRLVRHGSGTFLLVEYEDGWTKTLSRA